MNAKYKLGDSVKILLTLCNGTSNNGVIVKIEEINNEVFYDVKHDWIGILKQVAQIYLSPVQK